MSAVIPAGPFLLKLADENQPPRYSTFGALRIDEARMRAGRVALTATGVLTGRASREAIQGFADSGSLMVAELAFDGGTSWRGRFLVMQFRQTGELFAEPYFRLVLSSVGEIEEGRS